MRVSNRCFALLFAFCPPACASAEQLIPIAEGTTWNYEMVQERFESGNLDLTETNPKDRFTVTYRIGGTQKVDGKDLLKLETYRDGALANTDLITVDDRGVICSARTDEKGALVKLAPPQTILAAPLRTGVDWNFDGQIGETKVRQHYHVAGEAPELLQQLSEKSGLSVQELTQRLTHVLPQTVDTLTPNGTVAKP
jgi:hypothetical protein